MNIILFGAPGAGKGTQSNYLQKEFGMVSFSMGEALRAEVAHQTQLGCKIQSLIESGRLASDDVVQQVFENNLRHQDTNIIFDGFPRKLSQVDMLNQAIIKYNLKIDVVIVIDLDEKTLINRIVGRYSCQDCNTIYNEFYRNPTKEGICDNCNDCNFTKRKDDNPEILRARYKSYLNETLPIIDLIKKSHNVEHVDGNGSYDDVYKRMKKVVTDFVQI